MRPPPWWRVTGENGDLLVGESGSPKQRGKPREPYWAVVGSTAGGRLDAIRLLSKTITGLEKPWRLHIAGLDEPAARLLASVVPGAAMHPADAVPVLDLDGWVLPNSVQAQYDRAGRRIAVDELAEEVVPIGDPLDVLLLRDAIEAAHVARDRAASRPCDLDSRPHAQAFWRTAWNAAAAAGQLEVAALLLDGDLAAYCASYTEPPYYRVFDSRMVTGMRRYSPGRRLEKKMIDRASGHGYKIVDWTLPDRDGLIAFTRLDPAVDGDRRGAMRMPATNNPAWSSIG